MEVFYPHALTWDSEMYMRHFAACRSYSEKRELRLKQFQNTVDIVQAKEYLTEAGVLIQLPDDIQMMHDTVLYSQQEDLISNKESAGRFKTKYEVVNMDCLRVVSKLVLEGLNPALLNLANGCVPGAGPIGSVTQEEVIFRQTNIFRSLYQFDTIGLSFDVPQRSERYPLNERFGGIYTPSVVMFREGEARGYKLKDDPICFSVISVAAIDSPYLKDQYHLSDSDADITKDKIRTILRIGKAHNHDSLVLGAFGCGAFRNPPRHIASLFHIILSENEFYNQFQRIVFAIIEDKNSTSNNSEGNFKPFFDEFM